MKRHSLILSIVACLTAGALPAAGLAAGHGSNASGRAGGRKPTAPSFSVMGFGVNRLFVPKGTTVKSSRLCDEMVGSDSPIGPPQQVYLTVFVKATGVPHKAATQIKDALPYGDDEFASSEFTDPAPFSRVFAGGSFPFGSPPGSQTNVFHTLIVSASSEAGAYEGPSAEEFDGEYSFTASVKVGHRTLTSTAKVAVDCPQLR